MNHIGIELIKVSADARGNGDWHAIFGPARNRDRRNIHNVSGRRKSRLLHCRGVDAHVHALAEQIADKAVQCLIGPVPNIIVIARKKGNAKVARLHARAVGVSG